jgi:hypothetical protein
MQQQINLKKMNGQEEAAQAESREQLHVGGAAPEGQDEPHTDSTRNAQGQSLPQQSNMASDSKAMLFIEKGSSVNQNQQSKLEGQEELAEGESSGSHASRRGPALSANQVTFNERAQIIKQHTGSDDDDNVEPYRQVQDLP